LNKKHFLKTNLTKLSNFCHQEGLSKDSKHQVHADFYPQISLYRLLFQFSKLHRYNNTSNWKKHKEDFSQENQQQEKKVHKVFHMCFEECRLIP